MGILNSLIGGIVQGGFGLLGNYLDKKRQEKQDEKAFKLIYEHLSKQPGWDQNGILPIYEMLSSQRSGMRGVLPTDPNFSFDPSETGTQGNWRDQQRQPFIDYQTGDMYIPLGSGNYYIGPNGDLIRP